ncbi:MAG: FtsW/RodA/SpoVE family cell cycle protein, partial [Spartobacteria bacterium]
MQKNIITVLLIAVAGLIALGLVMLFSTGAYARDSHGDMYLFVKRQGMWLIVGICAALFAASMDYHFWRKWWWVFFAGSAFLLLLCFIPPIGQRINGSSRWINLGFGAIQPSEFAKVSSIFFVAWWFSREDLSFDNLKDGLVIPLGVLAIPMALIVMEVDIGNTALIGATAFAVMFVAGAALRWLAFLVPMAFASIFLVALMVPERVQRLLAFLDPEKYRLTEGLQQWQGLIAFGSGGVHGLGLGEGRQKMHYLPYAHTDFIFPMIGEELGLKFTALTVTAFLVIMLCGALISANSRDRFGMLLGFGCTMMITIQSIVNLGVTTSLL